MRDDETGVALYQRADDDVDDYVTSSGGNGINGYRYDLDYEIHGCKLDSVMHRTVSQENIHIIDTSFSFS